MGLSRRALMLASALWPVQGRAMDQAIIDDLSRPAPQTALGTHWQLVTDGVMGGVSTGALTRETVRGRLALRLRGRVRLDNDGGFIQAACDLDPGGASVDAGAWQGIALTVCGNGTSYNLHLRTADVARPWQSYRQGFEAPPDWAELQLPFAAFAPHRLEAPFDPTRLRRLGIVAIGRTFEADLAVARLAFY